MAGDDNKRENQANDAKSMPDTSCDSTVATCPEEEKKKVSVKIFHEDGTSDPPKFLCVKKALKLKAVPGEGQSGTFAWATTSNLVTLTNDTSATVTVTAKENVSGAKDDVSIEVSFTAADGNANDSSKLTVFCVKFLKPDDVVYGYDDIDGGAAKLHHVSVKKNGTAKVKVKIEGGPVAQDLFFTSDDEAAAMPEVPDADKAKAEFNLTVKGKNKNKAETSFWSRSESKTGEKCTEIKVNVYKEREKDVKVAKVYDSTKAASNLTYPNFDVAAAATEINKWYKAAVGKLNMTDKSGTGGHFDIRYDLNGNGKMDLEPGTTTTEETAITTGFTDAGQRVVIVKDLTWQYFLKTAAAVDDETITLKDSMSGYMKYIKVNKTYKLGTGASEETIKVKSKAGQTITLDAKLTKAHTTSDAIMWPLGGLSGNPIYVKESNSTEAKIRWIIAHECGHSLMKWKDLKDTDNVMYYSTAHGNSEVRYMDKAKHYEAGNENQWQTVPRT